MISYVYFSTLFIVGTLLTSYFVVVNTSYAGDWRDKKCNVYFNYTHFEEDQKTTYPMLMENLRICYNNTMHSELNLTLSEKWDCLSKCNQIYNGHAQNNGTLSPNLSDMIKEQYQKYSNATSSYIKKVINMFTGCANKARDKLKLLRANGTNIGKCEINGFYDDCCSELFHHQVNQNATDELCGNR